MKNEAREDCEAQKLVSAPQKTLSIDLAGTQSPKPAENKDVRNIPSEMKRTWRAYDVVVWVMVETNNMCGTSRKSNDQFNFHVHINKYC